jgi:predicted O-methyltransferase YrrM
MVADSLLANPPPFDDILSIFVEEDFKHFQHDPAVLTRRCYNFYAGYGAAFRPRSILEIGVRRGYSAFALVHGAKGAVQRFVGLDFQEEGAELIDSARRLLVGMGVPSVEISTLDTQLSFPALTGPFSLVHVDADHSTRGALSDLANALPLVAPDGVIVVDDYDHPPVAAGVQALLAVLGPAARRLRIANYRGHMLIWPNSQRLDLATVFARLPDWAARLIEVEDLVVAARQVAASDGTFALRARAALCARLLAALAEALQAPPWRSLPTGAVPGLQALLDRAQAIARAIEGGPRAEACREALAELGGHVRYCRERIDTADDGTARALFAEFSLHAANFAGRVAAPLLVPEF